MSSCKMVLVLLLLVMFISNVKLICGSNMLAPVVKTEDGIIEGIYFKTLSERTINAFLGVPFAKPPTGELRFQPALPPISWSGVMYANNTKEPCLQYNHLLMAHNEYPIIGSEDCLYLNVFTPKFTRLKNLMPVLVFIHGGAFMFGRSDGFTPRYLLDENNFLFVTLTYRVGPLGFLSNEDSDLPGNNGLKDQVMALKWINKNIEYFGGDPSQVTIAGLSAGGASVHLHYFSPLSRNLFKRGISLSGSAICPWAQMSEPKRKTTMLADSLGCPTNNTKALISCLQKHSGHLILSKTKELFFGWLYNPISPFGPTVEPYNEYQFLKEHPKKLLTDGNIQDLPWLVGFTTEEGLYPTSEFILNGDLRNELINNWYETVPHVLSYNYILRKQKNFLSDRIRSFYLNETKNVNQVIRDIIKMTGDRLYVNPLDNAVKMQSLVNKSPIYVYNFAYRGRYSLSDLFTGEHIDIGVSHGDDVAYVLNCYFSCTEDVNDALMIKTMVNLFSDYVKNGKPLINSDVKWTPVSNYKNNHYVNYLFINSSFNLVMQKSNNLGNSQFWDSLQISDGLVYHDEL